MSKPILPNQQPAIQGNTQGAAQQANDSHPTVSTDPHIITAHSEIQRIAQGTNYDNIPAELQALPQWCLAASKDDKKPLTTNGDPASTTDRSTWTDFQTAREKAEATGQLIGFVLTADDPFACIDIDIKDCNSVDKKTGQPLIEPEWSTRDDLGHYINFISASSTYTEFSASGRGIHTWFKANVGRGRRNRRWEVYDRERFIICTGNSIRNIAWQIGEGLISVEAVRDGVNPIGTRQNIVDSILYEIGADSGHGELAELEEVTPTKSDAEILEIARNATNAEKFNRLYSGDTTGYPSTSEADFALLDMLCFYTKSNEQVRELFKASKLGKREKHNKHNGYHVNLALQKLRAKYKEKDRKSNLVIKSTMAGIQGAIDKAIATAESKRSGA